MPAAEYLPQQSLTPSVIAVISRRFRLGMPLLDIATLVYCALMSDIASPLVVNGDALIKHAYHFGFQTMPRRPVAYSRDDADCEAVSLMLPLRFSPQMAYQACLRLILASR